ncbi:MAG: hypothetical protein JWO15_263 [Sphingomonadales bacterium]|nr:hypothetical protein [Sphingomonadales bacterium]
MTEPRTNRDASSGPPPGLAGQWAMAIKWRTSPRFWRAKSGAVSAKAVLYDDAGGFGMEVHSPGSDSITKIARWTAEAPGSPMLHYIYEVVPKANAPQGSDTYTGAAILHYYPDADELRGNYWTSRMTIGEFELRRLAAGEYQAGSAKGRTQTRRPVVMRWFGFVISAVLLFAVLYFLLSRQWGSDAENARTPLERQIEFAVEQASKTCLMNLNEREQRSIETGVREKLRQYGAGGYTSIERTRKSVNEAFSEAGQIEQGRQLRDCMAVQTDKFLSAARADPALIQATTGDAPKGDPEAAPTGSTATGPATGYVYYEEDGGRLTDDGVFAPLGGPVSKYGSLRRNQILKSVRAAQLRAGPSGRAPLIKMLDPGQCVQIVTDPSWPQAGLTKATSGGRLNVRAVSCREPG